MQHLALLSYRYLSIVQRAVFKLGLLFNVAQLHQNVICWRKGCVSDMSFKIMYNLSLNSFVMQGNPRQGFVSGCVVFNSYVIYLTVMVRPYSDACSPKNKQKTFNQTGTKREALIGKTGINVNTNVGLEKPRTRECLILVFLLYKTTTNIILWTLTPPFLLVKTYIGLIGKRKKRQSTPTIIINNTNGYMYLLFLDCMKILTKKACQMKKRKQIWNYCCVLSPEQYLSCRWLDGGWSLVMKIDGTQVFSYSPSILYWRWNKYKYI